MMKWRDLKLTMKMLAGFGAVLLFVCCLGFVAFSGTGGIVNIAKEVIEGNNPFYQVETVRQIAFAALNTVQTISGSISFSFGASI